MTEKLRPLGSSKVTKRYQVTLPPKVRKQLGVRPRETVVFALYKTKDEEMVVITKFIELPG